MKIHLHEEAAREVVEIADYYLAINPALRDRFGAELDRIFAVLITHPAIGTPLAQPSSLRRLVMQHFPYSLFYQISLDEDITVIALAHHAMRPGYWVRRTKDWES